MMRPFPTKPFGILVVGLCLHSVTLTTQNYETTSGAAHAWTTSTTLLLPLRPPPIMASIVPCLTMLKDQRLDQQHENNHPLLHIDHDHNILLEKLFQNVSGEKDFCQKRNVALADFAEGGIRGLTPLETVSPGQEFLRIPLSKCFLPGNSNTLEENIIMGSMMDHHDPDEDDTLSLIPLVMAILDKLLLLPSKQPSSPNHHDDHRHHDLDNNHSDNMYAMLYRQVLPSPDELAELLPVRWTEEQAAYELFGSPLLQNNECLLSGIYQLWRTTRQEREQQVQLVSQYRPTARLEDVHYALDLIQTRCCRVELLNTGPDNDDNDATTTRKMMILPIMAPIFDMINHAPDPNQVNAYYYIDNDGLAIKNQNGNINYPTDDDDVFLVVKSYCRIPAGQQIWLDYGSSARTSISCLFHYGFVPKTITRPSQHDTATILVNLANENGKNSENKKIITKSAFQVSCQQLPYELVEFLTLQERRHHNNTHVNDKKNNDDDESFVALTPEVAMQVSHLAHQRISQLDEEVLSLLRLQHQQQHDDDEGSSERQHRRRRRGQVALDLLQAQRLVLVTLCDCIESHNQRLWRFWQAQDLHVNDNDEVVFLIRS